MEVNDYASHILKCILAAFPSFKQFVAEESNPGDFSIKFDSPSGFQFWLLTEASKEETTVSFNGYHCHFNSWEGFEKFEGCEDIIEFIQKLMNGDYEIAMVFKDGKVAGSSCVTTGEMPSYWEKEEGIVIKRHRWA